VPGIQNVGVGCLSHLQPSKPSLEELTSEFHRVQQLLPADHLPIAGDSDFFTLSLNPSTFGAIYWWNHDTVELDDDGNYLESAGYLLASSFDEFLTRIVMAFENIDDGDLAEPDKEDSKGKSSKPQREKLLRLLKLEHTPKTVKEIKQQVKEIGDFSEIADGEWPFTNIGNSQIIECVLRAGLNPEIADTDRHSLLWQCASSPECIAILAEHGVKIDRRRGPDGETALMRATYDGDEECVQCLLDAGANPTRKFSVVAELLLEMDEEMTAIIESESEYSKAVAIKMSVVAERLRRNL